MPRDYYMKWAQALDYICSHASNKYTLFAGLYNMMWVLTQAALHNTGASDWNSLPIAPRKKTGLVSFEWNFVDILRLQCNFYIDVLFVY